MTVLLRAWLQVPDAGQAAGLRDPVTKDTGLSGAGVPQLRASTPWGLVFTGCRPALSVGPQWS